MIFVDTTGLYAYLDADDREHARAAVGWGEIVASKSPVVSHNYVLGELISLVQRRRGIDYVRRIRDELVPALDVVWVERDTHEDALTTVVASERRAISFVDRVSFAVMRRLGITRAFAYDPHFRDEGFELVG